MAESIITANRLTDGVVWLDSNDEWTDRLKAQAFSMMTHSNPRLKRAGIATGTLRSIFGISRSTLSKDIPFPTPAGSD